MDKLQKTERRAPIASVLHMHDDIEEFIKTVQAFLKSVIEASVSWACPALEAKPFWNKKCGNATKATHTLWRTWTKSRKQSNWKAYMHSNDKKQKTIKKAENLYFRTQISNTASSLAEVWQLAKWTRTKSQAPRKVPKMPFLTVNGQTANTFEEKIDALKEIFFPAPPNADLSDLEEYVYPSM